MSAARRRRPARAPAGLALLGAEAQALRLSLIERIGLLGAKGRRRFFARMGEAKIEEMLASWPSWARPGQLPPAGEWRLWLMMAGRGYGKTRAGAEWIHHLAEEPGRRIAIVGPTEEEARRVMIEGASGLLGCARDDNRPTWEPSLGRLVWPSGATGFVYSAANAEALRGPEHDYAWCDEIAKWAQPEACWDNLMFGLRRGRMPRALATTTPRPTPLIRRLAAQADTVLTRGRTADNVLLPASFVDHVTGLYGGTRLGRQELDGELIEDVDGALWPRGLIERCRILPGTGRGTMRSMVEGAQCHAQPPLHHPPGAGGSPSHRGEGLRRIVVGVDPPASAGGDACGIVVCGVDGEGVGYVLADRSVRGLSPEGWARAVAAAAEHWGADLVVAESNQGGEMVASVLAGVDAGLPVRAVHARFGKAQRAGPVAVRFEAGRAKFAGIFPELEDELAGMTSGGGYEGPGRSPDRADAMVWAMTELLLGKGRGEPRVRAL